ncbi:MAG: hypothetical protein A2V85_10470 [Chloroflexi bacterium RBG_16_72_14]|nr:MAG: hypothetical protein A2V85_10470 [Chloroflexi bacterium RBG_16_72_14]
MLFDEARNDGRQREHGSWSFERGHLTNGHLLLHFEISPPSHGLPVKSGPAVLFAGMEAFGGSGDVGMSEPMAALASTVIPACDDSDCRLSADIDLPTSEIADAIARLEKRGDLMWVSVNLTLVRTFGAGQWLQVLPLQPAGDGVLSARAGQLGAMEAVDGTLFPFGLFPADQATSIPKGGGWMFTMAFDYGNTVERLREQADDPSTAVQTVDAAISVGIKPTCEHAAHLTLHDDAGDRAFDAEAFGKPLVEGVARLPIGVRWHLTLQDGGGIDFDQGRQGWGVRIGEIEAAGSPIEVVANFDCAVPSGSLEPVGAAVVTDAPPTGEDGLGTTAPSISDATPRDSGSLAPSSNPTSASDGSAALLVGLVVVMFGGLVLLLFVRRPRSRA